MKKYLYLLITGCLIPLLFTSCVSNKKLAYFRENPGDTLNLKAQKITNSYEPVIQPDDILAISVSSPYSSMNTGTGVNSNIFNSPLTDINVTQATGNSVGGANNNNNNITVGGYRVNGEGYIEFPLLGAVHIGGLTTTTARDTITARLTNYIKEPIVDVRFINFKVTVLGEVTRPSTYTVPNEKVTILDALGMAGDMTVYGKRDNVLVIREENGQRIFGTLNLNSKDVFKSPYFYLHQNDVIYVEPNKAKAAANDLSLRYLPYVSIIMTAIYTTAIILRLNQ